MNKIVTPIFEHAHQKITKTTFGFPEIAPACKKNQFIPSVCSWDTVNFRVPTGHTHAQPKIFWSTFNFSKFESTCKKSGCFIDLFWRYGCLKNLAIYWLRPFWPISQEQKFSQIWDLRRNIENNTNFHLRTISVKTKDQIF